MPVYVICAKFQKTDTLWHLLGQGNNASVAGGASGTLVLCQQGVLGSSSQRDRASPLSSPGHTRPHQHREPLFLVPEASPRPCQDKASTLALSLPTAYLIFPFHFLLGAGCMTFFPLFETRQFKGWLLMTQAFSVFLHWGFPNL